MIKTNELHEEADKFIKDNGIKQSFFSKYIGVSETKASRYLNGKGYLDNEQLNKVKEFLSR